MIASSTLESASFRDRTARVFHVGGSIYRALRPSALEAWEALEATRLFGEAIADGRLVRTELVDPGAIPKDLPGGPWTAVLRHEKIPFVSYPYEWSFGMLRDAAILHLDLLLAALVEGLTIKDATPFNVQFRGHRPVFIDVASFERLPPGEPWVGYRQFCEMFLYPLLLEAHTGVAFQTWFRGSLEGVNAEDCKRLLGTRDLFRAGVFRHVYLHAAMQRRQQGTEHSVRSELKQASFPVSLIANNVRQLTALIRNLRPKRATSAWSDYASTHNYTPADHAAKAAFISEVSESRRWGLVWDLGCNTGTFSRIAAMHADLVVASDADPVVIEELYAALSRESAGNILPLVVNAADPSPGRGWRGLERKAFTDRGKPDLVLCLALVHHLVIGAHVPLPEFIDWLASLTDAIVLEFVAKSDPMVQGLLRNQADIYDDYEITVLEGCLRRHFSSLRQLSLCEGRRTLYFASR